MLQVLARTPYPTSSATELDGESNAMLHISYERVSEPLVRSFFIQHGVCSIPGLKSNPMWNPAISNPMVFNMYLTLSHRHSMQVEFAQIPSMEFVMQPKEFDAGLCRGRCPPRYHPAHHHALIQGLLRRREQLGHRGQRDGPRGPAGTPRVPRPCCAPARLKPLDVLFVDEDDPTRLKLSEWSDMTVVTCSCA